LFGTATEEDLDTVANHVNILIKSQSDLLNNFKAQSDYLSSFMTLTQERSKNVDALLTQQQQTFIAQLNSQGRWMFRNNRDLAFMVKLLFDRQNEHNLLQQQIMELQHGVHSLLSGFLPSSLITVNALQRTITSLQAHLRNSHLDAHLREDNPAYYYTSKELLFTRAGNHLFVTVKFPICYSRVANLNVYKIQKFPVPLSNNSNLVTLLKSSSPYLAVSSDAAFHTEEIQPTLDKSKFHYNMLLQGLASSCLAAIFLDEPSRVTSHCSFQVMEDTNIIQDLFIVNYPQILIRSPTYLKVECPYSFTPPQPCAHCFFSVPCACAVKLVVHFYQLGLVFTQ